MALSLFRVTIVTKSDAPFNVIPAAAIEIKDTLSTGASGPTSSIFSDQAGTTPITQPGAVTDAFGQFEFFGGNDNYNAEFDNNGTPIIKTISPVVNSRTNRLTPETLAIAVADNRLKEKDVLNITEFKDDLEGGGFWSVVLLSSVTANTVDIIASTGGQVPALALVQRKSLPGIDVSIPDDFPTIQDAINFYQASTYYAQGFIDIVVKNNHLITAGVDCRHGDFSKFRLKLEAGANTTIKLATAFVGVDTSGVSAGVLGETPRPPLMFGFNSVMPQVLAIFDMENGSTVTAPIGTGYQLAEASGFVDEGCGVINAGFRGAQIHGRANLYASDFSGATGTGLRLQQASSVNARSGVYDDCCKTEDLANSAVYASRSSVLEFRGGSAQNSGAAGLIARRSIVTADEANFDTAADKGVIAENNAQVSFANGSALSSGSSAIRCIANANVYAVGVGCFPTSGANSLDVDVGGVITVAGSTTLRGIAASEAQIIADSNVLYTNAYDTAGMIFFDAGNGTFKITSNANGISQRFADGRMIAWTAFQSVNTGTIATGTFSGQLTLPIMPDTFVVVTSADMQIIGRDAIGGGGSRICCDNYHRPSLVTGTAWRVFNTGQQLDGVGTGLTIESVNVVMVVHGTWR